MRIYWLPLAALLLPGCTHAQGNIEGAALRMGPNGPQVQGIRSLSGSDGVTTVFEKGGSLALADRPGTQPPSSYLYFDVEDARAAGVKSPVYVVVEYYDDLLGGAVQLDYDGEGGDTNAEKYRLAEDRAGGWTLGTKSWRKVAFELRRPLFQNRENCGADFRLSGTRLYVRSIRITRTRPTDWAAMAEVPNMDIKPLVKIGAGGQLIIGGFDPARKTDVTQQVAALEAAVPGLKALGVTSHEGYVRWNLCEPEEGKYDWSVYDAFAAVYKKHNLKWVPFLIVGSAYSVPDWYYKHREKGYQGYVCLEHNQETDVQSLWSPELRKHVGRFIQAFCEHYRDMGVIEGILLGVTGNYGEAIYVATGNDWTADIHGPYHAHSGYWAGDPHAVRSFQQWLVRKYRTDAALKSAWGQAAPTLANARPFLRQAAPNDRAWLDMCDWYIGSMTEWSSFWMSETRKHFPKGDVYLCTGGHAPSEHGADFGDQCKISSAVGGGVRITNEASDYRGNFSLTRWVASASRQYGAYFSYEPAGEVNARGVIARIYGTSTAGAKGLHYYFPNIFQSDEARENFVKWGGEFKQRKPITEIAVYYPETHIKLNGHNFLEFVQPLRDRFDFDFMSDQMILDGGLKRTKALVLMQGAVSEAAVWKAIAEWRAKGGLVLAADGIGTLHTVEGDNAPNAEVLGSGVGGRAGGRVVLYKGNPRDRAYRDFVVAQLGVAPELSPATRAMVTQDGKEDNVFVSLCEPGVLVWLNYTDQPQMRGGLNLPPLSIGERKL